MKRPTIRAANYRHLFTPAPASPIRAGSTAQAAPQPANRTAPVPQPAPRPTAKGNSR
jgi:hypothetical protein